MQPERIMAVCLRQWYLVRGSMTRLIPMFVLVGIDFVPMFLGAMMLWGFLVRVMQGTTMAFMEDTWSRNFLNLFATPITISEYVTGLVISSIATSAIGLIVMLVLAMSVFGLSFLVYGMMIVPFVLVLFLFGIALGIVGCSIMLRLGPAAEWFVWPIPALLSPFACVFYPKAILPQWMQAVSSILPPSYVFESMRAMVAGGHVEPSGLAISLALAVGYIILACWGFTRVYAYALRSGLIARYSAETVS